MNSVYGTILRWLFRHLFLLITVTALFMLPWLFPAQFDAVKDLLRNPPWVTAKQYEAALKSTKALEASLSREVPAELKRLANLSRERLEARTLWVETRLDDLSCLSWPVALATANQDAMQCHVESVYRKAELDVLRGARDSASASDVLRRRMENECDQFKKLETDLLLFEDKHRPWHQLPFTDENKAHVDLVAGRNRQLAACERAETILYERVESTNALELWTEVAPTVRNEVEGLLAGIKAQLDQRRKSVLYNAPEAFAKALPRALAFIALLVLVPIGIKAGLYWVFAPLAERRPGIVLQASPENGTRRSVPDVRSSASRREISRVSMAIDVEPGQELVVRSDFLQSSAKEGSFGTQWLLDARHPLTSLASGMVVLTRIRGESTRKVVVSSKNDPHSEIGAIELQAGTSIVLLPHCLVGIRQGRGRPTRVTSHWRVGSLTAWLTLQLRFLVFHGPATLIVQGCRGVRVEEADGGRRIDQAATIGFEAHLAYSVTRCETFTAYLLGKHGLFNDHFSGGPGFYVYEEMPYVGKKSGVFGRGLEGLIDAVRRIFGI